MKHTTTHPQTEPAAKGFSPGFAALGLEASLLATLEALGYEEPTPIQREGIPPLLEGRDLLGQAATGTGKGGRVRLAAAATHCTWPAKSAYCPRLGAHPVIGRAGE